MLDLPGVGAVLAELASSNLLLVPLDRRGQWYRYHHRFRDMLLAELERVEPGLVPELRRRAAGCASATTCPRRRWLLPLLATHMSYPIVSCRATSHVCTCRGLDARYGLPRVA